MILNYLKVKNFRNIKDLELKFGRTNIIYGDNAQGKTSLVEAISYLSNLKSFRGDEEATMIKNGEEYFSVDAGIVSNDISHEYRVVVSKGKRKIQEDQKEVKKLQNFIGNIFVVTFSPSDVLIFKEAPRVRREFIDDELIKLSPSYYLAHLNYFNLLKSRNEALKADAIDHNLIDVYTQQIAKYNLEILRKRKTFVAQLSAIVNRKYQELVENPNVKIDILYQTFTDKDDLSEDDVYSILKENLEDDILRRVTQTGIHRDDILITLNDLPLASYGSQGQMRLCSIAIKLALIEIAFLHTGEKAIVVLDDVFSELDNKRQEQLIKYLELENQIFITTAHIESIKNVTNQQLYHVCNGMLEAEE